MEPTEESVWQAEAIGGDYVNKPVGKGEKVNTNRKRLIAIFTTAGIVSETAGAVIFDSFDFLSFLESVTLHTDLDGKPHGIFCRLGTSYGLKDFGFATSGMINGI
uniref:Uncharacterized protein n=1 Tax=Glossina austeni TaxID=7395 RepID=A0A1A9V636_GLOAU